MCVLLVIKSRRWARRVANMNFVQKFRLKNLNGRHHLRELGVDGRIILKFI
jgi:hypothetical protein